MIYYINPGNQARMWNRKWDTYAAFWSLAEVVKTPAQSRPSCIPPSRASRRTMTCVSTAQSVLCVRRSSPASMEVFGCVQHSTSAWCVWLITVFKSWSCLSVPEVEKGPQADRDPVHPWRPGSASVGSKWKSGENDHRLHLVYIKAEVRYSDEHKSPPSSSCPSSF